MQQNVQLSTASPFCGHEEHSPTTEVSSLPDRPLPRKPSGQTDPLCVVFHDMGLSDTDIDTCEVSAAGKERLINLIADLSLEW